MSEVFVCNLEIPENNEIFSDIEKDLESSKNFQNRFLILFQTLLDKENQNATEFLSIFKNIQNYLLEHKYFHTDVKKTFIDQLKYFEEIYKYRSEKFKNDQNILKNFIDEISKITSLNRQIKNEAKIKFEKSQMKLYSDLNNISKKTEYNLKIQSGINEFKFQKQSYLNLLKNSQTCFQMINASLIVQLFECLQEKNEKSVYIGVVAKHQSANLKEKHTKKISDFSLNNEDFFLDEISKEIFPLLKTDYHVEGYLNIKNKLRNPTLVYACMSQPLMNLSLTQFDGKGHKTKCIQIKKCEGDNDSNEIRIESPKEIVVLNAFNNENLNIWVTKLNGTMISNEFVKTKSKSIRIKDQLKSKITLKLEIIRILITIIEDGKENIYCSKSHNAENHHLPSISEIENVANVVKLNSYEAFLALRLYIEKSDSLIPTQVYTKYLNIESVKIDDLLSLLKLIPEKNLQILSMLFIHFEKMINMRKEEKVESSSLSAIFAQIMCKSLVLSKDPRYSVVQKCNLFTDLLNNANELFTQNSQIENESRNQIITLRTYLKNSEKDSKQKQTLLSKRIALFEKKSFQAKKSNSQINKSSFETRKDSLDTKNMDLLIYSDIKINPTRPKEIYKNVSAQKYTESSRMPDEFENIKDIMSRQINKVDTNDKFGSRNSNNDKMENNNLAIVYQEKNEPLGIDEIFDNNLEDEFNNNLEDEFNNNLEDEFNNNLDDKFDEENKRVYLITENNEKNHKYEKKEIEDPCKGVKSQLSQNIMFEYDTFEDESNNEKTLYENEKEEIFTQSINQKSKLTDKVIWQNDSFDEEDP